MNYILLGYIAIMNLTGFIIMGVDKTKAKNKEWRIRERTLFLIAMIGGSIGMFLGMQFFHHKTKHLSFTIGIPIIFIAQLVIYFFIDYR